MSYVMADALQRAVFGALAGDAALMGMVNNAVYDALPPGQVEPLSVVLGAERVRDRSDATRSAALHEFAINILSDDPGYQTAKRAAVRISELLDGADLNLDRGTLVQIDFYKANARQRAGRREVEVWFRAIVEDA